MEWLERVNEAGVLDALTAIGTLLAVAVALLPSISNWWRRPKLRLEIPPNHFRSSKTTPPEGIAFTATAAGTAGVAMAPPDTLFMSTAIIVRNEGISPAVGTRAVVTDAYRLLRDGSIQSLELAQRSLPGGGELSEGLAFRLLLANRVRIDGQDSGMRIGSITTASVSTMNMVRRVQYMPAEGDMAEDGSYLVRLVISATNARAKSHVLLLSSEPDHIRVSLPSRGVVAKLKRADRARAQPQISSGF